MAAIARWTVDVERAPIEEEEYFSFQIRPRSGISTGDVDGAEPTVEIVDAIVERVDVEATAVDVAPPSTEQVVEIETPRADPTDVLAEAATKDPEVGAFEESVAEVSGAELRTSETATVDAPMIAAASPESSSIGEGGAGAPARPRLGLPTGSAEGASAADASGADVGPLALEAPPPVYPSACVRRGEEGSVLCALHVDTAGRVTEVEVLQSSGHRRLDEAAKTALRRWRFEPARKDGRVVHARIQHRVHFRLE